MHEVMGYLVNRWKQLLATPIGGLEFACYRISKVPRKHVGRFSNLPLAQGVCRCECGRRLNLSEFRRRITKLFEWQAHFFHHRKKQSAQLSFRRITVV